MTVFFFLPSQEPLEPKRAMHALAVRESSEPSLHQSVRHLHLRQENVHLHGGTIIAHHVHPFALCFGATALHRGEHREVGSTTGGWVCLHAQQCHRSPQHPHRQCALRSAGKHQGGRSHSVLPLLQVTVLI